MIPPSTIRILEQRERERVNRRSNLIFYKLVKSSSNKCCIDEREEEDGHIKVVDDGRHS